MALALFALPGLLQVLVCLRLAPSSMWLLPLKVQAFLSLLMVVCVTQVTLQKPWLLEQAQS